MNTAVVTQVRVEPELRAELDAVLTEDETLSDFVETAVRRAVEHRRVQTAFHARGQAAFEHHQRTGIAQNAKDVFDSLQAKLDARRKQVLG
jgi:Arc/MetJ-type ribon-helix-helix transcriptional regulator